MSTTGSIIMFLLQKNEKALLLPPNPVVSAAHSGIASDAVRDQMMRHDPKFATFHGVYLNEKEDFDLQNTFLGEKTKDQLYKLCAHVSLTRDPRATRDMFPKRYRPSRRSWTPRLWIWSNTVYPSKETRTNYRVEKKRGKSGSLQTRSEGSEYSARGRR